jgi:hypothetical protein
LKSITFAFLLVFISCIPLVSVSAATVPCSQKSSFSINPCHGGGSGGAGGFQDGGIDPYPIIVTPPNPPAEIRRIGGGPNLGHLGSVGSNPSGEPGGHGNFNGGGDNPRDDERPRKRNCVLFDGVNYKGQIIGVATKSCGSFSSSSEPVTFAVETFTEVTQEIAKSLTIETIQALAPEHSSIKELSQEINATLEGTSEAAINEFLDQTMAQISANLGMASVDIGADIKDRMKKHLLDEVNMSVQEIGGGPSLFILNQGTSTQNFSQDGVTAFASPHGAFREKVKDLNSHLEEINPENQQRAHAKDLARSTLKVADEENYLGNDEVAIKAFDIATELTDFAAGVLPVLSTAKGCI